MTTLTHAENYVRTEAGKVEIRAHRLPLTRSVRNLLMVIDASCSGQAWIAKVHGSQRADLDELASLGLIAVAGRHAVRTFAQRVSVEKAVRDWSYDALYTLLTHEARERFGLIKGYRLILKIEGATGPAAMHDVALDFVEQIRKAHGEESAARFRKLLGATD